MRRVFTIKIKRKGHQQKPLDAPAFRTNSIALVQETQNSRPSSLVSDCVCGKEAFATLVDAANRKEMINDKANFMMNGL